jgi:hypothetical protein
VTTQATLACLSGEEPAIFEALLATAKMSICSCASLTVELACVTPGVVSWVLFRPMHSTAKQFSRHHAQMSSGVS